MLYERVNVMENKQDYHVVISCILSIALLLSVLCNPASGIKYYIDENEHTHSVASSVQKADNRTSASKDSATIVKTAYYDDYILVPTSESEESVDTEESVDSYPVDTQEDNTVDFGTNVVINGLINQHVEVNQSSTLTSVQMGTDTVVSQTYTTTEFIKVVPSVKVVTQYDINSTVSYMGIVMFAWLGPKNSFKIKEASDNKRRDPDKKKPVDPNQLLNEKISEDSNQANDVIEEEEPEQEYKRRKQEL